VTNSSKDKEHFQDSYLPEAVSRVLTEALSCYVADLRLAFALLCQLAIDRAANEPGGDQATEFSKLFDDACRLAGIDEATRGVLAGALFGDSTTADISADQAAVLVEIVKDMFQQRFVRPAKLRRAIEMRRLFASDGDNKVTPITSLKSRTTSADR